MCTDLLYCRSQGGGVFARVCAVPQIRSTIFSAKSPAKVERTRSEMPAPVLIKRRFEFDDESVVLPMNKGRTLKTQPLNAP